MRLAYLLTLLALCLLELRRPPAPNPASAHARDGAAMKAYGEDGPRRFLSEMDDVERRYTLAIHDVYCDEKPVGHTAMAHEPFDGMDDPSELVPWGTLVAALASHGIVLVSVGAGHRTSEPHDCFLMNCATLGEEVAALREEVVALRADRPTPSPPPDGTLGVATEEGVRWWTAVRDEP